MQGDENTQYCHSLQDHSGIGMAIGAGQGKHLMGQGRGTVKWGGAVQGRAKLNF